MTYSRMASTMKACACLITVCAMGMPVLGRDVSLVLAPQKIPAEADKWSLLPPVESLTDGDAVEWYDRAVAALPADVDWIQIDRWLQMPAESLPLEDVREVLNRLAESLRLVARGARCREGNWPELRILRPPENLAEYRRLAFVVRLRTKLVSAQGRYDEAVLALQTGLGMARHFGQSRTILHALIGTAIGNVMCWEIEQLVQVKESPNLCFALASLPRPLVDMEQVVANEKNASSSGVNKLITSHAGNQLSQSHNRAKNTARRLDANLAALQCVEAIRLYAASHGGQLPQTLADITEVSIPTDPGGHHGGVHPHRPDG